ncbi:MAG: diguanylate cyclase [Pseudomonadota bacterium]
MLLVTALGLAIARFVASGSDGAAARFFNGRSLRRDLVLGLLLVGTAPALALGIFLAERSAGLREARLADRLEESALAVAGEVERYMDKHEAGVATAASAVSLSGSRDREALTRWLLVYHGVYGDFLTMLSADAAGDIVTATSNMTGFLAPVTMLSRHNVSDRSYFQRPMANGGTFVSRVFEGRDLGRDPIVAISAAVRAVDGARVGIVEGSLNLRSFAALDSVRSATDYATVLLVDQDNRVIYAQTDSGYTALQSVAGEPLLLAASAATGGAAFEVAGSDGQQRGVAARATTRNGWTAYVSAPLYPIVQQMLRDYGVAVALLLWAVVLSLLLAGGMLRRLTRTVTGMNAAIDRLKPGGPDAGVVVPADTPEEFRPIFSHMQRRSRQLKKALKRLADSLEAGEQLSRDLALSVSSKDEEIAARTAELEAANARLSELSRSDALTGIGNRRAFNAFLSRIWRHAVRDRTTVAVIMLDLDHFKPFNDTLGHQAGDDCLKRVATTLCGCASRPLDLVARYGGEEFVVVLGNTDEAAACVVADRMRRAVADLAIAHPTSPHGVVTLSAGVASMAPAQSDAMETLLRAADTALYRGKRAGRNAVTGASALAAGPASQAV